MRATKPQDYDRKHAVNEGSAYDPASPVLEAGPGLVLRTRRRLRAGGLNNSSLWVPGCTPTYAPILDHGIRPVTRGVVIHVNAGYAKGTDGFFRNGLREPYGSEGVGAHFEISGRPGFTIYSDFGCRQYLPLDRVAWHAVDANGTTIGLEHAGFGRTVSEWERTHYNEVGNSAYRVAWILRRYDLGPPDVQLHDTGRGNVWPHSAGGLSWGGHQCPGDEFPWDMWLKWCKKAYDKKWMWR